MQITGRRAGFWLLAFIPAALAFWAAYLVGCGPYPGESWRDIATISRFASLSWKVLIGFGVVGAVFACVADRLWAYAGGEQVRPVGLIVCALALFVAMHLAIYDRFEWMELYPFAGFFIVSFLFFKFESRGTAALLFGAIVLGFYILCAKELGERDAERAIQMSRIVFGHMPIALN